ncbi:class I SAM-dependent methyltransferase [Streptosporangium sp. KLBMP 9127]|nr:class I SAM-dependent methyltransferase [Streptosporangium sp. KLBMP 9127]
MSEMRSVVDRDDLFCRRVRDQWSEQLGRRLDILVAGCGGGGAPPRLPEVERKVTGVDEDLPVLRAVTEHRRDLDTWALGDLRAVPVPPRSFDVVQLEFLLERIEHAELVLDRVLTGLRPGGLLLVRLRDRDSAYGYLDRALPSWLRRLLWRRFAPAGAHGVLPAIYEPVASREGMQSFCLTRGLRITDEFTTVGGPALRGRLRALARYACELVERLSGGRLTADHDEVTFVIRKPQNHFARLL